MGGHDDHDADINTIRLALKDRRHAIVLDRTAPYPLPIELRSCLPGRVHSMVAINETKHRCINCGKTEEMD